MLPVWLDRYYSNFEDWLAIATQGLSATVRVQLVEDMTAHYGDAVEASIAQGMTEEEAKTHALAQLGEPVAVREQYKRQFEPSSDMKIFFRYYDAMVMAKSYRHRPRAIEITAMVVCSLLIFGVLTTDAPGPSERMPQYMFLVIGAAMTAAFAGRIARLVAVRRGGLNGYRTLLAMKIMQFLFLCGMGCTFALMERIFVVPGAILFATFAWAIANEIRTWRRIRPVIDEVVA